MLDADSLADFVGGNIEVQPIDKEAGLPECVHRGSVSDFLDAAGSIVARLEWCAKKNPRVGSPWTAAPEVTEFVFVAPLEQMQPDGYGRLQIMEEDRMIVLFRADGENLTRDRVEGLD